MRVYFHDQNPSVDHFAYKLSNSRAAELLANGEGELIRLDDGRAAIHLHRRQAVRDNSWIERLELLTSTASSSESAGMPYIKVRWPESVKQLRANSQIPNVRRTRSDELPEPSRPATEAELSEYFARIETTSPIGATA